MQVSLIGFRLFNNIRTSQSSHRGFQVIQFQRRANKLALHISHIGRRLIVRHPVREVDTRPTGYAMAPKS